MYNFVAASLLFLSSVVETSAASIQLVPRSSQGFDYEKTKVRGVNLGGWFVTEPYINLSLYRQFGDKDAPVDEYHLCQKLGHSECKRQLEAHWKTWYTKDDFLAMSKNYGLNTVRIPIGYWAFVKRNDDPYVQGQVKYLDKALEWAREAGLSVWVDLHGAPGSQNGFDNSGLRDSLDFQRYDNQNVTLSVLALIAKKYGDPKYNDVISGIQVLNEPFGPGLNMDTLKQFYQDAYHTIRQAGVTNKIIYHDAFQSLGYWNGDLNLPDHWNIVIDHHHYQMFSNEEVKRSLDQQIQVACNYGKQLKAENKWRVVGEWSAALTDCAVFLNGVGRGARYDGTFSGSSYIGSCTNRWDFFKWTDEEKKSTRRYVEAQLDAYEQVGGWIFWCYKTENALEWDFRRLVDYGLFPFPFNVRQYPNQCGFS